MKALVVYNSFSPSAVEKYAAVADDDTVKSADLVAKSLVRLGWKTSLIELLPADVSNFDPGDADLVFNMCEWLGKDNHLEVELLTRLADFGVAYTGADAKSHLWGIEKKLMKKLMRGVGLPLPKTAIYEGGNFHWPKHVEFPAIIKPSLEHCSVGIEPGSVVRSVKEGLTRVEWMYGRFQQPILIEEFLPGTEYQVFVFETGEGLEILPPYETVYREGLETPLLYFEENWVKEDVSDKIKSFGVVKSKAKISQLEDIAKLAFEKMECRGYVRLDLREKDNKPYVLEINVNPRIGWDEKCDMRVAAQADGLNLSGVIGMIVSGALFQKANSLIKPTSVHAQFA
jgi:D-alanine-D-alanine ligase